MASSGTVSQTTIDVATIIEHAFRRSGQSPADQTADAIKAAQENLYFYLSQLANAGTSLWTIQKTILGTITGQDAYAIGNGVIDVRNILYRTVTPAAGGTPASSAGGTAANAFSQILTTACTQVSSNGNISYDFGVGKAPTITNVGIMTNGAQTYTLAWEYSTDNINWTTALLNPVTNFADLTWAYYDISNAGAARYFRVRETGGGILNVREIGFNTILSEIHAARLNIDQYTNLTNKTFQGSNVLQYWLDRQIPSPIARIWPVSNSNFNQLVVWNRRQIQDVGSNMAGTIEVPQRWIEAVVTELARRLVLELPKADPKRYQMLKDEADAATFAAQQEERDNSAIQITPNISCYTR